MTKEARNGWIILVLGLISFYLTFIIARGG